MKVELKGLEKLTQQLAGMAAKAKTERNPIVTVGYTAAYALAVHEDVEMKWRGYSRDPRKRRIEMGGDPEKARPRPRQREPKGKFWDPQGKGQAKFLEAPARANQTKYGDEVIRTVAAGGTLAQGLLRGGLMLQRDSQLLAPVDTGNLKQSAFTRLEYGDISAASQTGEFDTSGLS